MGVAKPSAARPKKRKVNPNRRFPGAKNFGNKRYSRPVGFHPSAYGLPIGGRPKFFQTVAELQKHVDGYFALAHKRHMPLGIFALSLYLGITYETFLDYELGKRDTETVKLSEVLKMARLAVTCASESNLESGTNSAGTIFHLQQLTRRVGEQWKTVGSNEITGKDGKDLPTGPTIVLPDNARGDLYSPPADQAAG